MKDRKKTIVGSCFIPNLKKISYLCIYASPRIGSRSETLFLIQKSALCKFDLPKFYISACSNSVQLVPLHPIIVSILFHHYKELKECTCEVEQREAKVNNKHSKFTVKEEEEEKEVDLLVPSSSRNRAKLIT